MPREQIDVARLSLAVSRERPAAAAHFHLDVFGFQDHRRPPEGPDPFPAGEYGHPWIELRIGNSPS